jgi:simple sugar transport system substrate-binding protein
MRVTRVALGLAALATLAACSQASSSSSAAASGGPSAGATAAGTTAAGAALGSFGITGPLPTKLKGLKITLVRQLSQGDFFEQWLAGAQAEAKALGIDLLVSSGNGNDTQQALYLQQAVNEKVAAIIVDHGFPQTLDPVIAKAAAAHIPLVAFDVAPGAASDPILDQDDQLIAAQSLSVLKADTGGHAQVIYAYVAGYRPLDLRNGVWETFKKANPGLQQVARIGVVNNNTTAQTADEAKTALLAHPGVTAIFAPYDAFAQGAVLAVNELGLQKKVKVYGADVSTADIATITAPGSPWVDTSATDPADVGQVAVRAAALLALGDKVPLSLIVPPSLITQDFLLSHHINTIAALKAALPGLSTPDIAPVP